MEKNNERIHVSLTAELKAELKEFADKWGFSSNTVARLAIAHYISLGNPLAINGEKQ